MVTVIIAFLAFACGITVGLMMKIVAIEHRQKDDDDFTGDQL